MNVYQISSGISYRIRKWGCAFLCVMYLIEKLLEEHFNVEKINDLARKLESQKALDRELTVSWDKVFEYFKLPYKVSMEKPFYKLKEGELEIQCWYNPATGIQHFVVGDGTSKPVWDPYPDSRTVREGYMISKRVFRKVDKDE